MIESHVQNIVVFYGDLQMVPSCLIAAMSAFKMIRNGCGSIYGTCCGYKCQYD